MTFVGEDQLQDYLVNIMRRFSGYKYISISKPVATGTENDFTVKIKVHKSLPVQDEHGVYRSDADFWVRSLHVEDKEFPGLVMDRQKQYTFGNPFRVFSDGKNKPLPNIGKDNSFRKEDESVEPL